MCFCASLCRRPLNRSPLFPVYFDLLSCPHETALHPNSCLNSCFPCFSCYGTRLLIFGTHPVSDAVLPHPPSYRHRCRRRRKRKVLKYDFLANLCETISLERLPISAGGGCDPTEATPDQVHDFVVCGRVAEVPGAGGEDEESSSGGGGDEEMTPAAEADLEEAFPAGDILQSAGHKGAAAAAAAADGGLVAAAAAAAVNGGGGGASRRGSSRRNSGSSSRSGGRDGSTTTTTATATLKSGGKPHVTFRSLFERLQARDEPSSSTPAAAKQQQPPPLSRDSSFQEHSSVSSPPLSRQGSNASLHGGSGRPFASPGPRGVRRPGAAGAGGGVREAASGEGSPSHEDEQAEDFDSRLVGRALRLSMKRKVGILRVVLSAAFGGGGRRWS